MNKINFLYLTVCHLVIYQIYGPLVPFNKEIFFFCQDICFM